MLTLQTLEASKGKRLPSLSFPVPGSLCERFERFLPQLRLKPEGQHPLFAVFLTLNEIANQSTPRIPDSSAFNSEELVQSILGCIEQSVVNRETIEREVTEVDSVDALGRILGSLVSDASGVSAICGRIQANLNLISMSQAKALRGVLVKKLEGMANTTIFQYLLALSGSDLMMEALWNRRLLNDAFKRSVLTPSLILVNPYAFGNVVKGLQATYADHDFVNRHLHTIVSTMQSIFKPTSSAARSASASASARDLVGELYAQVLLFVVMNCPKTQLSHSASAVRLVAQFFLCAAASSTILEVEQIKYLELAFMALRFHQELIVENGSGSTYLNDYITSGMEAFGCLDHFSDSKSLSPERTVILSALSLICEQKGVSCPDGSGTEFVSSFPLLGNDGTLSLLFLLRAYDALMTDTQPVASISGYNPAFMGGRLEALPVAASDRSLVPDEDGESESSEPTTIRAAVKKQISLALEAAQKAQRKAESSLPSLRM